ncbi:MAG: hypothetical protein QW273_00990, partial [Candidatus Pacearchaeota archaeon]
MKKIFYLAIIVLILCSVRAQIFRNSLESYETPFSGEYSFNDYQFYPAFSSYYTSSDFADYWPILKDMREGRCDGATDFAIMIPPGGCTPAVVRSDILAEQNVPVFCKLVAVQINPLIKVSSIRSLTFRGKYPDEVSAVRFYPARAGTTISNTLLSNPVINEIGYAVIILKKRSNESSLPSFVSGNITASLNYEAEETFGLGKSEFYLEEIKDEEWEEKSAYNTFLAGKAFIRAKDIRENDARIAIYINRKDRPYREVTLKEGEKSNTIYLPGLYCMAGFDVKLNEITSIDDQALLRVNNDLIWVRKGDTFLNERCKVESINIKELGNGEITIKCIGIKDRIFLKLDSLNYVNLEIDSKEVKLKEGEKILDKEGWYLAYIKKNSDSKINNEKKKYIILLNEKESSYNLYQNYNKLISKIKEIDVPSREYTSTEFTEEFSKKTGLKENSDFIILFDNEEKNIKGTKIRMKDVERREDQINKLDEKSSKVVNEYNRKFDETLKELLRGFPNTKDPYSQKVFAEQAFLEKIELEERLLNLGVLIEEDLIKTRKEFLEKYPSSEYSSGIKEKIDKIKEYDRTKASAIITINDRMNMISLEDLKKANPDEKKAEIYIEGLNKGYFSEGMKIKLAKKDKVADLGDYFLIQKINKNNLEISYFENNTNRDKEEFIEKRYTLDLNKEKEIGEKRKYKVLVNDIDLKKVAHITLIPTEDRVRSEANFSFKIGIEKRMFEIVPDKVDQDLKELNKTIKDWEKKLDSLGKVIENWKKVCFFTGMGLQVKNLLEGVSGKALARQEVMKNYREICKKEAQKGEGKNREILLSKCYNERKEWIEKDVESYTQAIKETNEELREYKTLDDWKKANKKINVDGEEISTDNFNSWTDVRRYLLYKNLKDKEVSLDTLESVKREHDSTITQIKLLEERMRQERENEAAARSLLNLKEGENIKIHDLGKRETFSSSGLKGKDIALRTGDLTKIGEDQRIEFVSYRGTEYLLVIEPKWKNTFGVNENLIFKKEGDSWKNVLSKDVPSDVKSVVFIDGKECKNKYKNPTVRYFSSSLEGLPAIVPFDADNGWYVRVSSSQGGIFSKEEKGYYESGNVRFFYVCNVGPNGIEENMGGDDLCQSFDINNYDSINSFGGCNAITGREVRKLGDDAQIAIRQAASQYKEVVDKKITKVRISVPGRKTIIADVEREFMGDNPVVECQDFMSINDCNILFNVCDPVVCPPSRCDFGGKMPVDNVIASGIAGSLLLCLPNFGSPSQGGVLVPICITGVHAGLDAYLSVLRAQYACLDEAKKTGKYVGVCDYITAVYKCEFFWRNAQPFLKYLIPAAVALVTDPSYIFRQKGGGEYLTFQTAWNNMEKSMNYFKNQYASTSFRAFRYSDVQEFGSEVCKMFIGSSFPTKGEAFDKLFAPDSPTQFYAEFSEIPFTEATSPPTSQYKVLYHIYAGNDQSVSFRVYLKDPPAYPYYNEHRVLFVASGALAKGKFASESRDFTAPAGYKQLCVEINGVEKCGFKQVTSDVGIEYLTKMQVKQETERRDITTESECVSGTKSIMGITSSLNIQEGVQTSLTPQISKMGIVRVCSNENPGKGVESSRWIEVGYCNNPNIKCWLDTKSINK